MTNHEKTCPTCGQSLSVTPWLDEGSGEIVLTGGRRRRISPTELLILVNLRRHGSAFVNAERLFMAVWGDRLDPPGIKNVHVRICNLRKKLAGTGTTIERRYALGYRLAPVELVAAAA